MVTEQQIRFVAFFALVCVVYLIRTHAVYASLIGSKATPDYNMTLNNGLVGWWTFDGGKITNGRVADSSGNGNDGSPINIATSTFYVNGKIGQAGSFNGSNNYVTLADTAALKPSAVSISAWIYYNGALPIPNANTIFAFHQNDIIFRISNSADLHLETVIYSGVNTTVSGGASSAISKNTWTFVTFTFDGTNWNFYKNAASTNSGTNAAVTWEAPAGVPTIGSLQAGGGNNFTGMIDDVRIYNRALSATEISKLYYQNVNTMQSNTSSFVTLFKPGLKGWWTMDGKDTNFSSRVETDESGNGRNGTISTSLTNKFVVPGKVGQALNTGTSRNVTVGSSLSNFMSADTGTVSVWFYPLASGNTTDCANGNMSAAVTDGSGEFWIGYDPTAGGGSICVGGFDGAAEALTVAASPNQWHHVVWRHFNGGLSMWLDGVFRGTISLASLTDITNTLNMGQAFSGAYLNGYIDDVRMWNAALATTSITELYNAGAANKINITPNTPKSSLQSGLVGWWTFDGNTINNGAIKDVSGNGNTANSVNIASSTFFVIGKIGQAGNFDGVNDTVTVNDNSSLRPGTGDFSTSLWFFASNTNQAGGLITKDQLSSPFTGYNLDVGDCTTSVNAGRRVQMSIIGTNSGTDVWWYCTSSDIIDGNWHHVVFTRSGGTGKIYIDGVSQSLTLIRDSSTAPQNLNNTTNLSIGSDPTDAKFFAGKIDDVRYYNRSLSQSEVIKLYYMGR